MATPVTDPAVLALLERPEEKKAVPVTDPAILAQLESKESTPEKPSTASGVLRTIENGLSFGMNDRIQAATGALLHGGGYDERLKAERDANEKFRTDHPLAAPFIQSTGSIASPLGIAGAAAKGATLVGKTLYGIGAGGIMGGFGGAADSPDWTDVTQTAKDTAKGAGWGATLGGLIPAGAKAIGSTYHAIADALTGTQGISKQAAKPLVEALTADGPAAVKAEAARLGPDATMADLGFALQGRASGAALNNDEARSITYGTLKTRDQGTNARIAGDVNRVLGPAEDPVTATRNILDLRSKQDNVNYPKALDNAPDVKTATILTQIDDMIPRTVGMEQKALKGLRDMLVKTERQPRMDPNTPGHQAIDARGNPVFDDVKVSQNDAGVLHKVKVEMDNVIEHDQPGLGVPAGAVKGQQATLKNMRGQLNGALEDQVPGYLQANRQSAALADRAGAVKEGTQYLGSGKTTPSPERFASEFEPKSIGEQIAFAKGSRGEIDRILGTKANDLQALRGELQGEGGWNTAKIATVHGQDAADELTASVDRNLKFRDTHNKVVENAQTAQRTAAKEAMAPQPPNDLPLITPSTSALGLALTGGKKLLNAGYHAWQGDPSVHYPEVAKVLTAQGSERDRHLAALVDTLMARQGHAANAQTVGDRAALAAALLGNGYAQSGPRQQQSQ